MVLSVRFCDIFIPFMSISCPTKGIVSKPTINILAFRETLRDTVEILFVCYPRRNLHWIPNEHVVDVYLTYVIYEAV